MNEDSEEALIEASSLGSEGARQLRDRSRAEGHPMPLPIEIGERGINVYMVAAAARSYQQWLRERDLYLLPIPTDDGDDTWYTVGISDRLWVVAGNRGVPYWETISDRTLPRPVWPGAEDS